MNFLRLLPVIISLLLLGAHFMRASQDIVLLGLGVTMVLLFLRKWWIPRLVQVVLVLGALEWVRTTLGLVETRVQMDLPWMRMATILGGVAIFTLLSGLVFQTRALRKRYAKPSDDAPADLT